MMSGDPVPEDVPKEVSELLTIPEIAARCGLSRQRVHGIARADPNFPAPVVAPGTTRLKYPAAQVDEYFANRELRPGRRTDVERKKAAARKAEEEGGVEDG